MNEVEKDAVTEVREQSRLAHTARMCLEHTARLATYARYNQRVDVRDEAYALLRYTREILREIEAPEAENKAQELARIAASLKARLHGAFPGAEAKNSLLYNDLKRFLRRIEMKGGQL